MLLSVPDPHCIHTYLTDINQIRFYVAKKDCTHSVLCVSIFNCHLRAASSANTAVPSQLSGTKLQPYSLDSNRRPASCLTFQYLRMFPGV